MFERLTRGFTLATDNPDRRRIGSAAGDSTGAVEELVQRLLDEVSRLADELQKSNLIELHRVLAEQTRRALEDPVLLEAMSRFQDLPEARRRQFLFVNAQYSTILLHYRLVAINWDELIGYLRWWCSNAVFQAYWDMTGEARQSLAHESLEARVGRAVDEMMEEISNGREWWVVGPSG